MNGVFLESVRFHAPMLVIVLPLVAAALASLSPSGRLAWTVVSVMAIAVMAIAGDMALGVWAQGERLYTLGGFQAPLGVEVRIDGLGAFGLTIVSAACALGLVCGIGPLRREIARERQPLAMALAAAAMAGLLGVAAVGDVFTLFIFLQIAWLAMAALTAMGGEQDRRALPAAFRQLLYGMAASVVFAFGAGFVYANTGAFDFARIRSVLNAAEDVRSAAAGLALMITGLGALAVLAPLHAWTIGAQSRGPHASTLLLGAAQAAAGMIAMARLMALVIGAASPDLLEGVRIGLCLLGAVSLLVGAAQAVAATDLRRLAAYAGAAQAGAAAIGLAAATPMGMQAALFHLLNQTAISFALFGAAAMLARGDGSAPLSLLDGLSARAPILSAVISAAALSLIGAPLTAGFLSKWLLLQSAMGAGLWWGAVAIVLSSLLAVVFAGRIVERIYFSAASGEAERGIGGWSVAPGIVLAAVMAIAFGFDTTAPLYAAQAAAAGLAWSGP